MGIMLRGFFFLFILALVNSTSKNDEGNKPHLFLHIGPHKTASTYIQSVLSSEVSYRSIVRRVQSN